MKQKNKVTIYALGGCGINIVLKAMSEVIPKNQTGIADINYVLADTTTSNLPVETLNDDTKIYLVPGTNGAGKDKKVTYHNFKPYLNSFIETYTSGYYNILVSSMSGGTGPVMMFMLLDEFMKRNIPTICILVGNADNLQEAENTQKTMLQLKKLAKDHNKPVPACMFFNDFKADKQQNHIDYIDNQAIVSIQALAMLLSGQNKAVDNKDITHWLHYNKLRSEIPSSLIQLCIFTATDYQKGNYGIVSVSEILLLKSEKDQVPIEQVINSSPVVRAVGFINEAAQMGADTIIDSHFYVLTPYIIPEYEDYLRKKLNGHKESAKELIELVNATLYEGSEYNENDDGVIL